MSEEQNHPHAIHLTVTPRSSEPTRTEGLKQVPRDQGQHSPLLAKPSEAEGTSRFAQRSASETARLSAPDD